MRVLVGWDDLNEAELIRLYLNVEEDLSAVCTEVAELLEIAEIEPFPYDIVLLSTVLPDHDSALTAFQKIRRLRPGCPVVGVCRPDDVYRLAPFLQQGLRAACRATSVAISSFCCERRSKRRSKPFTTKPISGRPP